MADKSGGCSFSFSMLDEDPAGHVALLRELIRKGKENESVQQPVPCKTDCVCKTVPRFFDSELEVVLRSSGIEYLMRYALEELLKQVRMNRLECYQPVAADPHTWNIARVVAYYVAHGDDTHAQKHFTDGVEQAKRVLRARFVGTASEPCQDTERTLAVLDELLKFVIAMSKAAEKPTPAPPAAQ